MKQEQIETFLTVRETGSMAKAAALLYTTQGTISVRIQQLEKELGIELFKRHKGNRYVELTPHGHNFTYIALRMKDLFTESGQLRDLPATPALSVYSKEDINQITFLPVYHSLLDDSDRLSLCINNISADNVHKHIIDHFSAVGFSTEDCTYEKISTQLLFRERLVIVTHRSHPFNQTSHFSLLDEKDEIYVSWSSFYDSFRNHFLPDHKHPFIKIPSASMISSFLIDEKKYFLAPYTIASSVINDRPDYTIHSDSNFPYRSIYLIYRKEYPPQYRDAIDYFKNKIIDYTNTLRERADIHHCLL
ncbi:MAG: LysR family transcriptional regulator [Lachnospiraceae bacterium]|nr:LysR family transcriptional regulator [Lachnospiraceae bacterium]